MPEAIAEIVARALAEDVGAGDLTAALIPETQQARAWILCRETAVLCGADYATETFRQVEPMIHIAWTVWDGDRLQPDQRFAQLEGPARGLLTAERVALNFLQTLSATATITQRFVKMTQGTHAVILDTRKTLPGLRQAQKYAVTCGGGMNHRMGLFDAILIKDNHIAAAGSLMRAVGLAREFHPGIPIEVEVEDISQLEQALSTSAERVLLDNFTLDDVRRAVALSAGRAKLEVSGGITLDHVRALAETGVDYLSIGALTKHIQAVDLSMQVEPL